MTDLIARLRDADTTRRIGESYADTHERRQRDREEAAARIEQLEIENIQMRFALGYPMPADLEKHVLPTNPFKCGTCDASAIRAARIEQLEAQVYEHERQFHVDMGR